MNLSSLMVLLLMGHVLGDFYFQSDKMAMGKKEKWEWMAAHGMVYAACIGLVLLVGAEFSLEVFLAFLAVSLSHITVDIFKKHIKWKPFVIDQFLHILTLVAVSFVLGGYIEVSDFVVEFHDYLLIALGLLIILWPVGLLIESGEIWKFEDNRNLISQDKKRLQNASKMIGYLERIIVFFLLLLGQYSAIALVIAAKSIARFPEIKDGEGRLKADYYIIGTMLSLAGVFLVGWLLGLMQS
ncbi:MAG: DUF3307 domain-containing protein [Defluviitaleaceae bacterium]|nr:DUF3307 domain-containing protein [Defluviitaleaceae bacterium]